MEFDVLLCGLASREPCRQALPAAFVPTKLFGGQRLMGVAAQDERHYSTLISSSLQ